MNLNTHKKAIVFDLDGTLINTAPDVRLALNHMLSEYHLPAILGDEVYDLIGLGALTMIQKAFAKFAYAISDSELATARDIYLTHYRAHPVVESYIYPEVREVLTELSEQGLRFGICTNKPTVMTHLVLEQFKLKDYFTAIVAGDDTANPKPHGQHILDVIAQLNVPKESSLMIGDSDVDKASALHAEVQFIGVTYGYSRVSLQAELLIDQFAELPRIIQSKDSLWIKRA